MRPATFTLLGSCASTAPYYRLRPPDLHLAAYCTGASLVSLMSPALPLDPADLASLTPFDRRRVEGDVTRSALDLLEQDSDFVLLDLGDEICDVLRIGESFVTQTFALKCSLLPSRYPDHEILRREDPATTRLWMDACTAFCRGPLAAIPRDRIIIHRVQLASECQRTEGPSEPKGVLHGLVRGALPWLRSLPLRRASARIIRRFLPSRYTYLASCWHEAALPERARALNPILETYFQHLRDQLPGAHVIDVPVRYRIADRRHRYGVHGLHYTDDYEECFMTMLRDITGQRLARGVG